MTPTDRVRAALTKALIAAGIEVDTNVCTCGHGGWDHDLNNVCLVCGDRFGSMNKAALWEWWMARATAAPSLAALVAVVEAAVAYDGYRYDDGPEWWVCWCCDGVREEGGHRKGCAVDRFMQQEGKE
jgi:hypothetical protein